jgi:leukotriene-A4 hydrolase
MTTNERTRLFYDPNSLSSFNGYRIVHTYFDLNVDFNSNILDGYVQFDIKLLDNKLCDCSSSIITENKEIPNNHGNKFVLDSNHLNIKKVLLKSNENEKPLEFQVDTERQILTIEMNDLSNNSLISILIYYSTSNTKCTALQWLTKEQTADKQYPYMFSQCQAIHARSLYPCQDTPGVKSTYSAKITCPKPLTVVNTKKIFFLIIFVFKLMSALQTKHDEDTNTFYFEQNQAIPSYLIAIAVGNLVSYDLSYRIRVWTEPSMIKQCQYEFEDAEQFLTAAEQLLGEYQWKRYDFLVLPPSFPCKLLYFVLFN